VSTRTRLLLIGSGDGVQPTIQHAHTLHGAANVSWQLLVLLGGADEFPFRLRPSTILVPGMPDGVIACEPTLEEFGIASRLASTGGLPGCYDGDVIELAARWLESLPPQALAETRLVVAGSSETVAAATSIAKRFGVPIASAP
jgi:dihydroorotate dehydrogenase electron transfer subunit